MSLIRKITLFIITFYSIILLISCQKYLDVKQDQQLVVPTTIQDLQALLDDYARINRIDPGSMETSSDNYYLKDGDWSSLNEYFRRMYIWEKEKLFPPGIGNDWVVCYNTVYKSNVVLYNIDNIKRLSNDQNDWNNVKGHALFLRGNAFLQLATTFSLAYDSNTASTDLGIPLRLEPVFDIPSVRANVQQTYQKIIQDLKESGQLLPNYSIHVLRPSRVACYALLARTYLSMRKYDSCFKYASISLQLKSTLLNYNSTPSPSSSNFPFGPTYTSNNPENVYDVFMSASLSQPLNQARAKIDSLLHQSYSINDQRKTVFFRANTGLNSGTFAFKGSYEGNANLYDGIATDEVYLMRAECYARLGDKDNAINDLNALMIKRWKNNGTWVPFTAIDANDALNKILVERRKELLMRGLRWMDIKRLNKEGANIILKRIINGQTYTLLPNDPRYALPIPEDVISMSGMIQNPR